MSDSFGALVLPDTVAAPVGFGLPALSIALKVMIIVIVHGKSTNDKRRHHHQSWCNQKAPAKPKQ